MADGKRDDILDQLRNGKKILCSRCGVGYMIPYNTSAEKAHSFNCSNPKCNHYLHYDPVIEID